MPVAGLELDSGLVRVSVRDAVAVLTLDDPARRNALTLAMVDDIVAAVTAVEADLDVRALVVTGHGPAFCAGADLAFLADAGTSDPQDPTHPLRRIYEGFLALARTTTPTVAAVNGAAVGAGMNLALACDVCLCSPVAKFDTRFAALKIHPGGGHTWLLQRRLGRQGAEALLRFGQVVDGVEAERIGLAWRCVPGDALVAEACRFAGGAARAEPDLLADMASTLDDTASMTHAEAVDRELRDQARSVASPRFIEGLRRRRQ